MSIVKFVRKESLNRRIGLWHSLKTCLQFEKLLLAFSVIFLLVLLSPLCLIPGETGAKNPDNENSEQAGEKAKPDIRVTNIVARINPQTEITLPAGSISEHFKHNFSNFWMIFNFYYNFVANEIGGDLTFEYPLNRLNPYITFKDYVDFENFIQPQFENNRLTLVPTNKYISRNRVVEIGGSYNINSRTEIFSNFTLNDLFKGDLTASTVIDEGTDLITSTGIIYDTIKEAKITERLLFKGIYYKSSFNLKARNKISNLVSLDHYQNFLLKTGLDKYWALDQKINIGLPLKIWQGPLASYYTLGGFETIRGYREQSINAYRFLSFSTTIHRKLLKKNKIKKKISNSIVYLHQFNIYLFYDQCFTQDSLPLDSALNYYSSIGGGVSFVVSAKKAGHLKLSAFAAQAIRKGHKPVVYFKTSFF